MIKRTKNHRFCPLLTAVHSAYPFQKIVHRIIGINTQLLLKSGPKLLISEMIPEKVFLCYYFFMRFLGVDYGSKRVGLAISDENGKFAFPHSIVNNDTKLFDEIGKIINSENIEAIVVGESTSLSGEANKINQAIEVFTEELKKQFSLEVYKQKEFLTSVEARRDFNKPNTSMAHSRKKTNNNEKVDAKAAALILQRYLDKHDNHR